MVWPGSGPPPSTARSGRLSWFEGTLTEAPWKQIEAFQPEACIHCAWTTSPRFAYDSPEHFRCLDASKAFVRQAATLGLKQVLGIGTCIEYRLGAAPLVEDQTPLDPQGAYAESKNAMRAWLEEEAARQGFIFTWARLFYVYGVGEDPTRLCTATIRKLLRDEPIVLKTPKSTKDYIYIDDVASALLLLLENRFRGAVNVGTGIGITIFDLAQTLARIVNKPGLVRSAVPEVVDPLGYVVADSTRLRSLGWKPEYDLLLGLCIIARSLEGTECSVT
jgi:nucleoside-diphosphate-sugar epimerase